MDIEGQDQDRLERDLGVIGSSPISRSDAERYWTEHRDHLNGKIGSALELIGGSSIEMAVLGAGNCNDFDLGAFVEDPRLSSISLIDLDRRGVEEALMLAFEMVRGRLTRTLGGETGAVLSPEAERELVSKCRLIHGDVTFFMESFIKRIDGLDIGKKSRYRSLNTPARRSDFLRPILDIIKECIDAAVVPENLAGKYQFVVSDCILSQILVSIEVRIAAYLRRKLLEPPGTDLRGGALENSQALWKMIKTEVPRLLIPHHIEILKALTVSEGLIFIASDQVRLRRAKVPLEVATEQKVPPESLIQIPEQGFVMVQGPERRVHLQDGNLRKIIETSFPGITILEESRWVWNRQPFQLQPAGQFFEAEEVHGVMMRNI